MTVKYKASVQVSGWVKPTAEARSIRKYMEGNSQGSGVFRECPHLP